VEESAAAARLSERTERVHLLEERARLAEDRLSQATQAHEQAVVEWRTWLGVHGLPQEIDRETALRLLDGVTAVRTNVAACQAIQARRDATAARSVDFEARSNAFLVGIGRTAGDDPLAAKWQIIRDVRRVVTGALEIERAAKRIGSSLEASPLIYISDRKIFNTLFDTDLAEVCITSNAMATNEEAPADAFRLNEVPGVAVVVEKAVGTRCARSWKILPTVGEDADYPDVSPRDAQALREWKALGVVV